MSTQPLLSLGRLCANVSPSAAVPPAVPCLLQYWVVTQMPIPAMCLVWAAVRRHVLWCVGWRECLCIAHNGEVNWTPRTTLVYPSICTLIGALAGLLGLGGGTFLVSGGAMFMFMGRGWRA